MIALTANAMPRDIERGLAAGFARYLTKPIDIDQFNEAIDGVLAQRAAAERTAHEDSPMISPSDIRRARILIVDDEPVNVQLLEFLLKTSGYEQVHSTTDPRQVAALHLQHRYDLIILDLQMPHMDGFQVMEALKPMERESWLPVLVVTAEPDKKLAALEAGARDFIGKPFDTVEVLTRIRNLLEVRLLHQRVARATARAWSARCASAPPSCSASAARWTPPPTPSSWSTRAAWR